MKSKKIDALAVPGLPAPVVVTVWNAQLDLKGADDPRLPIFLDFYGDGHTGPEAAFASCKGGGARHGVGRSLTRHLSPDNQSTTASRRTVPARR